MIETIVEEIGKLADVVNADKWNLAEAIYTAYTELPHHTQNLTSALCQRCKLSSSQLYNLKNAWELKSWFGEVPLSVSHYAKMHQLSETYKLTPGDINQYFELAISEGWSVMQLAQEIEGNHDMNTDEKEKKIFTRWLKTMRKCWQFALFNSLPKEIREAYYKLMQALEEAAK